MSSAFRPAGSEVGDFVIDALIGSGGMGQVYRARQVGLDRLVALKILAGPLAADPAFVRRFQREATMMRDLEHPAILTVYAAGVDEGTVYLATRLVRGPTLQQVLAGGEPMVARSIGILRPLAAGLDHAHSRGVVHRDIKPANVLLDEADRPFLADFGISKELGVATTVTGQVLGTPRYMAPEQAGGGGAIGHRADLYSLACVAFEMLTGSAPFTEEDTVPLLLAHANKPVPRATELNPGLPTGVDRVFDRGLAKDPANRYPSAQAFVDALDAALDGPAGPAADAPPGPAAASRRRRVGVAAGVGVVVIVGAAVALLGSGVIPLGSTDRPPAAAGPSSNPAASSTAAPPPVPSPRLLAEVPMGELVYEAKLDGTSAGFVQAPSTEADSAREAIRYVPGALELEAIAPGADTYTELDVENAVTTFVGEMDLAVRPGTDVELCWSLRWAVPRQLSNYWCVATRSESAQFSVYRRGEGRVPIGAPAVLTGLQTGQQVKVGLVVRDKQLSMYVNGELAADVVNDQVPVAGTLPGIEMESSGGTGLVRIEGLRIHDLGGSV